MVNDDNEILRTVELKASVDKVWRAISQPQNFAFASLPQASRVRSFQINSEGWNAQVGNISSFLGE
ncbi:MAG: hypothetical protein ACI9ON_002171 [Limisphaerales bacterium]|jgi:hypothetical protein